MPRTITFQPNEELSSFVESLVENGGYSNQSEVIRAGLRLLQEQTANSKLEELRRLIDEGEQSGNLVDWDVKSFLHRVKTTPHER
jgi:antitoxin ParD1/3/4